MENYFGNLQKHVKRGRFKLWNIQSVESSLHAVNTARHSHVTKFSFIEPIKFSEMNTAQATN